MIIATFKMQVTPKKRKELLQTMLSIVEKVRQENECIKCHFYQDMEDINSFVLVEEWQNKRDLNRYLHSDQFSLLNGAIRLLNESHKMQFNTILKQEPLSICKGHK
ncbi:Quinol monooxygenase YgiN [Desulfocicer vacuolatum DSM 3385]|uniref:Quinol monooxygenase YgiN n=1 Tax=Desulfocicer vacuolatum DSM 3385 TaxID=1121400 RepID=A0A1W2ETH2_9BACT|nr:Quinol monooxygenase YgiN [Desulfocicer vacuolatum DSM 3385]